MDWCHKPHPICVHAQVGVAQVGVTAMLRMQAKELFVCALWFLVLLRYVHAHALLFKEGI